MGLLTFRHLRQQLKRARVNQAHQEAPSKPRSGWVESVTNKEEGAQQYFDLVLRNVEQSASQEEGHTPEQLLEICEYLDLVDARTLVASQPLYRKCVTLVTNYLTEQANSVTARTLAKKSWAAKTLSELVRAATAREQQSNRRAYAG